MSKVMTILIAALGHCARHQRQSKPSLQLQVLSSNFKGDVIRERSFSYHKRINANGACHPALFLFEQLDG